MKKIVTVSLYKLSLISTNLFSASVMHLRQVGPRGTVTLVGGDGYKQFNFIYDTKSFVDPDAGVNIDGRIECKYNTKLKPASSQVGRDAITLSLQSDVC